ncbi:MAG: copper amine oxidase N-terminal domain-containing protein, partial [Caldisericia bacterium]|nr:copper amine oxidase N-terminal domain-containing protein [Caldisericia bacterium]
MMNRKVCSLCISLILLFSFIPIKSSAQGDFQLKAKPGCKEIILTWTPLEGAINYQPYVFLPDGTTYPLIDFPSNTFTYTHQGLTDGKEYCYEIVAYDKDIKVIGRTNKVCTKPKCVNCDIVLQYTVGKKEYFVNNLPFTMDSVPEIKNSRMFLVISFVTKHIPGTTIEWLQSEKRITITTAEGKTIKLWVDNPKAEVDGSLVDIDPANPGQGAPYLKDNRTEVPMRFVGNHLNAKIDWDGATSTVILKVRDTVNCDPPCCTYTTTNVIPPELIRELAPGQKYTYQYKFTNTCPEGHLPLQFSFSHRENITRIYPETFSLHPTQWVVVAVEFQMPTNATSDAEVNFSFRVNTDCGHNEEISWRLRSRSSCC